MAQWKCTICGYIYDSETGDTDEGIAAGTDFESIPESWECPVCGVGRNEFRKIED
jgi:rubredoxin